jgi:hypothetical protein
MSQIWFELSIKIRCQVWLFNCFSNRACSLFLKARWLIFFLIFCSFIRNVFIFQLTSSLIIGCYTVNLSESDPFGSFLVVLLFFTNAQVLLFSSGGWVLAVLFNSSLCGDHYNVIVCVLRHINYPLKTDKFNIIVYVLLLFLLLHFICDIYEYWNLKFGAFSSITNYQT